MRVKTQLDSEAGISLTELLVGAAMSFIVMAGALTLYSSLASNLDYTQRQGEAMAETRGAVDHIARHIRQADLPSDSIPPVITAQPRQMAFYEDVDRDGALEQVRYFVQGRVINYGVTEPDAGSSPPTYTQNAERVTPVLTSLKGGWTANVFTYYSNDDPPQTLQPSETARVAAVQVQLVGAGGRGNNPDAAQTSITTWVKIRSVFNSLD